MQKILQWNKFNRSSQDELETLMENGWRVVLMESFGTDNSYIMFVLEKDTRKEKLEKLNDISESN